RSPAPRSGGDGLLIQSSAAMSFQDDQWLLDELQGYGVAPRTVRLFRGTPTPDDQEYLNLISDRSPDAPHPDGVAEAQNRPILYFVDGTKLTDTSDLFATTLVRIRGKLACRGERAYLAVIEP